MSATPAALRYRKPGEARVMFTIAPNRIQTTG